VVPGALAIRRRDNRHSLRVPLSSAAHLLEEAARHVGIEDGVGRRTLVDGLVAPRATANAGLTVCVTARRPSQRVSARRTSQHHGAGAPAGVLAMRDTQWSAAVRARTGPAAIHAMSVTP
jgi:hypothetical protein